MSNPWAKSFEELRSPYLQEKMAKKDYDGDGKVESGKDEYFGSRDKAIKKAMGKKVDDKKKVAEHHTKDKDGNTIPHGDGSPSSVEEMKKFGPGGDPVKKPDFINKALDKLKKNTPVKKLDKAHYEPEVEVVNEVSDKLKKSYIKGATKDIKKLRKKGKTPSGELDTPSADKVLKRKINIGKTMATMKKEEVQLEAKVDTVDPKNKRKRRNEVSFGKQTKPYDPPGKAYKNEMGKFLQKQRKERHDKNRGVKTKVAEEMTELERQQNIIKTGMMNGKKLTDKQIQGMKAGLTQGGNKIEESDKKGSGSGTKDACYHKVKSRYSVWPSAYASGALVKCRKAGAKNWGNSSKKEEFDYYQMPMKSFGDIVGECWKTHKQQGTKMKGGKVVPNCVPKNEEAQVDEGAPYTVNVADKTGNTPAYQNFKKGMKNKLTGDPLYKAGVGLDKAHYDWKSDFDNVDEALKGKKLDIKETGVKNKIEINPELKTEAAKAPVKK